VRAGTFLLGTIAIATPIALPIYRWEYAQTGGKSIIWAPVSLVIVFVALLGAWGRYGHQLSTPWQHLGFIGGDGLWGRNWLLAWGLGVAGVTTLYGLQWGLGWVRWSGNALSLRAIAEGFAVALLVGLAEELVFRGWLLFELEQDYAPRVALGMNALLFAGSHYIRPLAVILETWPQFFGLLLLGLTLVWARRSPLRPGIPRLTALALPAGLHSGLVWAYYQVDVRDLVISTQRVPEWLIGVGGNPLAGALGIGLMGVIALGFYRWSHRFPESGKPRSL
jgi:membrane protease YdiL (CAAX protease family)